MSNLFDTDEVHKLLQIPQLVSGVGPGFQHILTEAMARLREINDGLGRAVAERNKNSGVSGQPVPHPEPTKPVEPPKSEIVKEPEHVEPEPVPMEPKPYIPLANELQPAPTVEPLKRI